MPPHIILFPEMPFERAALPRASEAVRERLRLLRRRGVGRHAHGGRQVSRRGWHQGRVRPHAARRRRPGDREHRQAMRSATSITGRSRTTCNAPRATSPRKSTCSRPTRWARPQWSSRSRATNAVMPTIVRKSSKPYKWTIGHVPLAEVANEEKKVPREYITEDGFGITEACRALPAAADRGRGVPPLQGRPAGLRTDQGRGGAEEAQANPSCWYSRAPFRGPGTNRSPEQTNHKPLFREESLMTESTALWLAIGRACSPSSTAFFPYAGS